MPNDLFGETDLINEWLAGYARQAPLGDLMIGSADETQMCWRMMLEALTSASGNNLALLQERVAHQVSELGMAFRLAGDADERSWPLSPLPLLIDADEWSVIERAMAQRAELHERIIADLYGPATLVTDNILPAPVVAGSPHYWRQMINVPPSRGRYLQFYAADLARGPTGEWRVLADHCRAPVGSGYALENRLAFTRSTGNLLAELNVRRLAPFFGSFRQGLAARCERVDPRIALLTPGRFNPSYAEQAHLARYLGFLLVEGEDLAVVDDKLYVRTIEGIKRVDALWRRMDTSLLDPLTFDARSAIGVPDLFDAISEGGLVIANWPGAGIIESRAFAAFMPQLAHHLLNDDLVIPNIATWWCGQPEEHEHVLASLDDMVVGSSFGAALPGLPRGESRIGAQIAREDREALLAGMRARPMDYVGQEVVKLSTTPALVDGRPAPRPFTLRVFVTRDADNHWQVMPGGFARLAAHGDIRAPLMGEGDMSADVCIVGRRPQAAVSLLDTSPSPAIRRSAGTLPSKAADNMFWLARYLERGEMTLRIVRAVLGGSIEADGGASLQTKTMEKLTGILAAWGAVPSAESKLTIPELCAAAISSNDQPASVFSLLRMGRNIGQGMRERLATDYWRLLSQRPQPIALQEAGPMLERVSVLLDRFSALSGLAAENMGRSHGWHFHQLGRRIERAVNTCRLLKQFADDDATSDDLSVLLDLTDCQIMYRMRYLTGLSLVPIRDMLALEAPNPRSLIYQIEKIAGHLAALPSLRDDGMPEEPVRVSTAITAALVACSAEELNSEMIQGLENRLYTLSNEVGKRFFLQSKDPERAMGMTRLA